MDLCNEAGTWPHIGEYSTFSSQTGRAVVLLLLASEVCGQTSLHITWCVLHYNLLAPKHCPMVVLTMHLVYKLPLARFASNSSSLSVIPAWSMAYNRRPMKICWCVKHFYLWKYVFFVKLENHQIDHFFPFRIAGENWMFSRTKDGSNQLRHKPSKEDFDDLSPCI